MYRDEGRAAIPPGREDGVATPTPRTASTFLLRPRITVVLRRSGDQDPGFQSPSARASGSQFNTLRRQPAGPGPDADFARPILNHDRLTGRQIQRTQGTAFQAQPRVSIAVPAPLPHDCVHAPLLDRPKDSERANSWFACHHVSGGQTLSTPEGRFGRYHRDTRRNRLRSATQRSPSSVPR